MKPPTRAFRARDCRARDLRADGIRSYFGQTYHFLYKNFLLPDEQSQAEAEFLVRRLKPRRGERWLDSPCGYGRHMLALGAVRRELRVVGIDAGLRFLREPALRKSGRAAQGDLRRLPFAVGAFHAVINMFNSFGYYPPTGRADVGAPDDRAIVAEWHRVLRPGGRLVMDLSNRRSLIDTVRRQPVIRYCCGEIETTERFEWDAASQCMLNETSWRWPGGKERGGYRLRLYTPGQIERLLERAGFSIESTYGDFRGNPFDPHESDRMLIVAVGRT